MTNQDCNTSSTPQVVLPPFTAEALPTLQVNVATAQVAGDLAHARAIDDGQSKYAAAEAYHAAFIKAMRDMGTPMPCSCDQCRDEGAAEQVDGWLMVAIQVR